MRAKGGTICLKMESNPSIEETPKTIAQPIRGIRSWKNAKNRGITKVFFFVKSVSQIPCTIDTLKASMAKDIPSKTATRITVWMATFNMQETPYFNNSSSVLILKNDGFLYSLSLSSKIGKTSAFFAHFISSMPSPT